MALLYQADLRPTKLELLAAWLPGRRWYQEHPDTDIVRVAAFRFDDPAGAVGIETMLVGTRDGVVYQVPLTYRGAPIEGGDDGLIGTTDHSVLGQRWVYDACADPVYIAALAAAILADAGQAEQFIEVDGQLQRREPAMTVAGSGREVDLPAIGSVRRVEDDDPTLIVTDSLELGVARCLNGDAGLPSAATLTGTWTGQPTPVPLASASVR
jgi:maltokinase-like protein